MACGSVAPRETNCWLKKTQHHFLCRVCNSGDDRASANSGDQIRESSLRSRKANRLRQRRRLAPLQHQLKKIDRCLISCERNSN
nr:putative integron gene cassette protein [uncultured bacterium]